MSFPWQGFFDSIARPPATHSGIGGYTGRVPTLSHSSSEPGRAPVGGSVRPMRPVAPALTVKIRPPFRPSPASALKCDSGGLPGASPGLNLILLQHRFTGVEG